MEGDVPLFCPELEGASPSLLLNPKHPHVLALRTTRGVAIWNACAEACIQRDFLKEYPGIPEISSGCWNADGDILYLTAGPHILRFDCTSS